jgi:RNA polymerase sigma-70 factor
VSQPLCQRLRLAEAAVFADVVGCGKWKRIGVFMPADKIERRFIVEVGERQPVSCFSKTDLANLKLILSLQKMVCRSDVQCQCLPPFLADTVFAETMTEDFTQEPEDRELFRQIKQGSEEAFREVYEKYHRILYAVALKMLKDRSAAENAVQYVFVKLWVGRQDMTVMLSLRNYLYTMTRNYILNYLRSRNTELVHSYRLAQLVPEASDPLDAQIEREDLSQVLDTVIARLPPQKRQVMHLRKAGYSNPEIAEMLNLSVNTVRSHYQEGVKLLKSRFGHIVLLIFILQTLFL